MPRGRSISCLYVLISPPTYITKQISFFLQLLLADTRAHLPLLTASNDRPNPWSREKPCQYNSCPDNAGNFGSNSTNPDLHWVNAPPLTALRFGIKKFGPESRLWQGAGAELAVMGPNVGPNIFHDLGGSGATGAAAHAVTDLRTPTIIFSGGDTTRNRWDVQPAPPSAAVYAELATNFTNAVIESADWYPFMNSAGRYMPLGTFLNVNFPRVDEECPDAASFQWVMSRITPWNIFQGKDVYTCGSDRLPSEQNVADAEGCYISVSLGNGRDKSSMLDASKQKEMHERLKSMLSCLPKK